VGTSEREAGFVGVTDKTPATCSVRARLPPPPTSPDGHSLASAGNALLGVQSEGWDGSCFATVRPGKTSNFRNNKKLIMQFSQT